MKKPEPLTKSDLLSLLTNSSIRLKRKWKKSLIVNDHMNDLTSLAKCGSSYKNEKNRIKLSKWVDKHVPDEVWKAIIVDFINHVAAEQGIDYGLHTKHI